MRNIGDLENLMYLPDFFFSFPPLPLSGKNHQLKNVLHIPATSAA